MFIDSLKKNELVIESERLLLSGNKIKFSFDKNWSNNFTKLAGVYAVFCNDDLLYIGESASIKERMKEIKRTINHSFRKKLGKHLFNDAVLTKGKYDLEIENSLNEYYLTNIYVSFIEVEFGRIEIEEELIKRNLNLLNSISVRSSKYSSR
jgi:predicted GIY-YIG superfamily endonuclease